MPRDSPVSLCETRSSSSPAAVRSLVGSLQPTRSLSPGPAQRADDPEVLVADRAGLGRGVGEGGEELVPLGAGDEVVVPEDAHVPLTALDGDPVTIAAGRIPLDLADADELDEPGVEGA